MNQQGLPISDPVFLIETDKIVPNSYQPRKNFDEAKLSELASSIRELGMLQPIIVSKVESETDYGTEIKYELIAGERRLRAAQLLRMPRVPAIIKNVKLDQHRLEMAIVENIQRADLNPIESAKAYNRLQDEFKLTQREIASRVGKSRESVANTMRLLNLPTQMQEAVAHGKLSESQARILLSVEDLGAQESIFSEILSKNLSVRDVKKRVDRYKKESNVPRRQSVFTDPAALSLKKALEEFLGAQVKLDGDSGSGKITIEYHSVDELRELVEKLTHSQADGNDKTDELLEKVNQESRIRNQEFGLAEDESGIANQESNMENDSNDLQETGGSGQIQDSSVRMNNLETSFRGVGDAEEEARSKNQELGMGEGGDEGQELEKRKSSDENLHPDVSHEDVLPAVGSEHEIVDSRDEFDPFKSHGF